MERRKYPRIPFRGLALWRGIQTLDNLDPLCNISETGACFAMKNLLCKIGETIQLTTNLSKGNIISVLGVVRWIGPGGVKDLRCRVGVQFKGVPGFYVNELRNFVGVYRYGAE